MLPIEVRQAAGRESRSNPGNSVTRWITALEEGDQRAAQALWEAYFGRLSSLARARLRDVPRRIADEEDVFLNAFESFCRRAQEGRFPRLDDRHDLWQILVLITVRKAINLRKYETRQSRRVGSIQSLAQLTPDALEAPGSSTPTWCRSITSASTMAELTSRWNMSTGAAWPKGSTAPRGRLSRPRVWLG
jgi:DNA-directed RNA polymerase specialized sigma24 family protein